MPLINCEINLMLYWSENCFLSSNAATNQAATFAITDTKLYVPVLTLSTQDNAKLLQQLKSEFKRIIIWSKYQSRVSSQTQNQYLDYLIDPNFQGAKRLFVLSFAYWRSQKDIFFQMQSKRLWLVEFFLINQ